jgi:hypothetical protein
MSRHNVRRILLPGSALALGLTAWELLLARAMPAELDQGTTPLAGLLARDALWMWPAALLAVAAALRIARRSVPAPPSERLRSMLLVLACTLTFALAMVPAGLAREYFSAESSPREAVRQRFLCSSRPRSAKPGRPAFTELLAEASGNALALATGVLPLSLVAFALVRRRRSVGASRLAVPVGGGALAGLAIVLFAGARPAPRTAPVALEGLCPAGTVTHSYNVSAIDIDLPLDRSGNHDSAAFMYVLDGDLAALRAQEHRPLSERVSTGLHHDLIQPLVLRANLGDCFTVRFTNRLARGTAAFHVDGLAYSSVGMTGGPAAEKPLAPGDSRAYVFPMPTSRGAGNTDRAYYVHDDDEAQVAHGLFGVVVAEPAGSRWLDVESGEALAGTSWEATIAPGKERSFREFVLIYHDIGEDAGGTVPASAGVDSGEGRAPHAINYRLEPSAGQLPSGAHGSGEPVTPVPRTYPGDRTKARLVYAGPEVSHVHPRYGDAIHWERLMQTFPGQMDTVRFDAPGADLPTGSSLNTNCGPAGCKPANGEFQFNCRIQHHSSAGTWSLWHVFDTRQPDLAPLPDPLSTPQATSPMKLSRVGCWFRQR